MSGAAGFYAPGETESAAEAAFTLPGGLVVPSVEIITFQAVGVLQAARQNCMNKNSKWDVAASQMREHSQVPRWLPVCPHDAGSWSHRRARHPQGPLPTLPGLCPRLESTAEIHGQNTVPQNMIHAAQVGLLCMSQSCWIVCSQFMIQDEGLVVPSSGMWRNWRGEGESEGGNG